MAEGERCGAEGNPEMLILRPLLQQQMELESSRK
jgi:hypothetical protein